jgi:hypothetical protein
MKRLKRRDFIKTKRLGWREPVLRMTSTVSWRESMEKPTGQPRSAGSSASLDKPGGQRDLRAWEALGVLLAGDMVR